MSATPPLPLGMQLSEIERDLADSVSALAASEIRPIAEAADGSDELLPDLTSAIRKSGLFRHSSPSSTGGPACR